VLDRVRARRALVLPQAQSYSEEGASAIANGVLGRLSPSISRAMRSFHLVACASALVACATPPAADPDAGRVAEDGAAGAVDAFVPAVDSGASDGAAPPQDAARPRDVSLTLLDPPADPSQMIVAYRDGNSDWTVATASEPGRYSLPVDTDRYTIAFYCTSETTGGAVRVYELLASEASALRVSNDCGIYAPRERAPLRVTASGVTSSAWLVAFGALVSGFGGDLSEGASFDVPAGTSDAIACPTTTSGLSSACTSLGIAREVTVPGGEANIVLDTASMVAMQRLDGWPPAGWTAGITTYLRTANGTQIVLGQRQGDVPMGYFTAPGVTNDSDGYVIGAWRTRTIDGITDAISENVRLLDVATPPLLSGGDGLPAGLACRPDARECDVTDAQITFIQFWPVVSTPDSFRWSAYVSRGWLDGASVYTLPDDLSSIEGFPAELPVDDRWHMGACEVDAGVARFLEPESGRYEPGEGARCRVRSRR
jgi:hypothetical protein